MTIPFLDLKAQYATIKADVGRAVMDVLDSGAFALGPAVTAFEAKFAAYCETRHAVATNSGTAALHLALEAAGIGEGDEVITTPMTFVATVAAILYARATPVLVDVDPATWTIDPSRVEAAVTRRTKAIMPVHLHGLMADMDPLADIARRRNLLVIEDAAQAHGATYRGRFAGSVGRLGCFSFYPGKNLGAYGEGGAVTTDDDDLAKRLRMLRDWGQETKYVHALKGHNARMDGVQGAVLGVKMNHIEAWTEARRAKARLYDEVFAAAGIPHAVEPPSYRHVYHVYAILSGERDRIKAVLDSAGIGNAIHYPTPVHLQPAYAEFGAGPGSYPVSEALSRSFLSLPLYPELADAQVAEVAAAVVAAEKGMSLAEAMDGARVVVTGGAGFIGSALVRLLDQRNATVIAVDNLVNGKAENLQGLDRVHLVVGDIRDDATADLIAGADIVFHLACLGVRHSLHSPYENHLVNADATLRLLATARSRGVRRFVTVSTSEVYGTCRFTPMTEDHPTLTKTVYGGSKLAGESYTRAYWESYRFPTVVVRPFNAFGPRCHHEGDSGEVIPKFMLRAMAGKPLIVFGDGSQTRDFTYVEDTARAILLAGIKDAAVGETLNVGQGREISVNDLAAEVAACVGAEVEVVHEAPRPGDVLRLLADSEKADRLLGYRPSVSLREGLSRLRDWYLTQPGTPDDRLRDEMPINWSGAAAS